MATDQSRTDDLIQLLANGPPPNVTAKQIDFHELGFPEYRDYFAVLIDGLFSKTECQAMLQAAEASSPGGWEQAMVNVGNGQQRMIADVRLCDRILWDAPELAAQVLDRVMPHLPSDVVTITNRPHITGSGPIKRKEVLKISRLNERLRFLKYTEGMYFRTHCDGSYVTPDRKEITFLTVHLYLNGDEAPSTEQPATTKNENLPLIGGSTRFFGMDGKRFWDVNPKTGSVLVFQHRNLLHSGEDVEQGTKYTMRSDVLYTKVEN